MKLQYKTALERLATGGWDVRFQARGTSFHKDVLLRYSWLPNEIVEFLENSEAIVSPDEKSWFNTSADLSGQSGRAFLWNQWELDSLTAAEKYPKLKQAVRSFWDQHFPILMSVKNGYGYFAIKKEGLAIVCGEEPEYEEPTFAAESFAEFLENLCSGVFDHRV